MSDPISPTATQSTAGPGPGEVRSIQYLRGIAALGVLVFHVAERAGGAFGPGAAGVDIFFVISGFIMWMVTAQRATSPGRFFIRRFKRIVPLYWALTLAVAAVAVLVPGAFPVLDPTLETLVKSLLFIPHLDPGGHIAPLIVPGWTLNYEMFFYAVFAVSLLAPARLRPWLITVVLLALVAARPLGDVSQPLWATYTNPLLLEFGAGVWLGQVWSKDRLPGPLAGTAMMALGIALFVVVSLAGVDVERARVLYWGLPALLVVAGAVSLERRLGTPDWPPLRALGDASYSVYLIHGLAISAMVRALAAFNFATPAVIYVAGLTAGVAAGLLTYHVIERPLTRIMARTPA